MNNIRGANIVILKQPIIEKVENNYKNLLYPITVDIWSQKKNLEVKKFQPMLQIIKPARRNL